MKPKVLANRETSEKRANQEPPEETTNQEPRTAPQATPTPTLFEALTKKSKRQKKYDPIIPQPILDMDEDEMKKQIELARNFFWDT